MSNNKISKCNRREYIYTYIYSPYRERQRREMENKIQYEEKNF